jgi:hypothetical protein
MSNFMRYDKVFTFGLTELAARLSYIDQMTLSHLQALEI